MEKEVKLQLRLPADVRDWLKFESKNNDRSMNGQMVALLRERMEVAKKAAAVAP